MKENEATISAILSAFDAGAFRYPVDYRVTGWLHDQTGTKLGAGSSFPWPGTYTAIKRWTRTQDGGASSVGKTFETREELDADVNAHYARNRQRFEEVLAERVDDTAYLADQLAYWQGEARKKVLVPA